MMCIAVPASRTHRPAVYHRCPSHIHKPGLCVGTTQHANSFVVTCAVFKKSTATPLPSSLTLNVRYVIAFNNCSAENVVQNSYV